MPLQCDTEPHALDGAREQGPRSARPLQCSHERDTHRVVMKLPWPPNDNLNARTTCLALMGAFSFGTVVLRQTTDTPGIWIAVLWIVAMIAALAYRPVEKARKLNHLDLRYPNERPFT